VLNSQANNKLAAHLETTDGQLFGSKDVTVLSINEWITLVGIYKGDDHFDPL